MTQGFKKSVKEHPDNEVSGSVLQSFSKHTCYLTEELVLLSLFSDNVSDMEKREIAEKLKSYCSKKVTGFCHL